MKYDKYKAFPYPVLRPECDDYLEADFQADITFTVDVKTIKVSIVYTLSSPEIIAEIENGTAEYVTMVSCRDTYMRRTVCSSSAEATDEFDSGLVRGEVRAYPYVIVRKRIAIAPTDINPEFGPGPFAFEEGDVLAQDQPHVVFIDRDMFRPVTSVFDLVKRDDLEDGLWRIAFDDDHVVIQVSPEFKSHIDDARNDQKKRIVLLNSIYFAAVMQAIQKMQDSHVEYASRKWAQVIQRQADNMGLSLETTEAYLAAEKLMKLPARRLETQILAGGQL